jgi:GAF domain-containing protein
MKPEDDDAAGASRAVRTEAEHARIKEALEEERRILELLNQTGATLASNLDLERLVQAVTDAGTQLSGAQFGAFFYTVSNAQATSSRCTRCRARRARPSRSSDTRARRQCSRPPFAARV